MKTILSILLHEAQVLSDTVNILHRRIRIKKITRKATLRYVRLRKRSSKESAQKRKIKVKPDRRSDATCHESGKTDSL